MLREILENGITSCHPNNNSILPSLVANGNIVHLLSIKNFPTPSTPKLPQKNDSKNMACKIDDARANLVTTLK